MYIFVGLEDEDNSVPIGSKKLATKPIATAIRHRQPPPPPLHLLKQQQTNVASSGGANNRPTIISPVALASPTGRIGKKSPTTTVATTTPTMSLSTMQSQKRESFILICIKLQYLHFLRVRICAPI